MTPQNKARLIAAIACPLLDGANPRLLHRFHQRGHIGAIQKSDVPRYGKKMPLIRYDHDLL